MRSSWIGTREDMPNGIVCHVCGKVPDPKDIITTEVAGIPQQVIRCRCAGGISAWSREAPEVSDGR